MAKQKLRKITVAGAQYLWKFSPGYRSTSFPSDPYECYDTFTAFLAGSKSSPLHVHFITWESPGIGGPLRGGWLPDGINLHTPKWAAIVIQAAKNNGWAPEQSSHPVVIENGLKLLAEAGVMPDIVFNPDDLRSPVSQG